MTCECGNAKRSRAPGCDDCQRIERERKAAESPTAAILNAIRKLDDWPSAVEACLKSRLACPTRRQSEARRMDQGRMPRRRRSSALLRRPRDGFDVVEVEGIWDGLQAKGGSVTIEIAARAGIESDDCSARVVLAQEARTDREQMGDVGAGETMPIAEYIATCFPDVVLALVARVRELDEKCRALQGSRQDGCTCEPGVGGNLGCWLHR